MILQALYDLYERLSRDPEYDVSLPGYSLQKITFKVVLKPDGTLHAIEDARIQKDKKMIGRQIQVPGATKSSGSGLNPGFLWDNTGYMLGYLPNDKKPERTLRTFESFRERHLRLESQICSPAYHAVCQFLKSWHPQRVEEYPIIKEVGPGFGVFQILGETAFVHEDPIVQEWWVRQQKKVSNLPEGQCLITGNIAPIARLHPKIKKVGEQPESLLVSFNDPAYESYGKEQSFNAPVSEEAAFRYGTALNVLLAGKKSQKHRFLLGDTVVAFWTKEPSFTEDIFSQFASQGSMAFEKGEVQDEGVREKIKLFLKALREGKEAYSEIEKAPETPFYILGLTGQAKGRIGVRFFYYDTISHLLDNLRKHYMDMGIKRRFGENTKFPEPEFPAIWQLLDETCPRSNGKPDPEKISHILSGPLLRAVITGSQYPAGLYNAIIRRIHADADKGINYIRACIIKGYLKRNLGKEVSMGLDPSRKEPAYLLGRLFAALEKTQQDALKDVSAGIRERFYSAASSTPATVFPRLLRLHQHHLAKMEKGKIGREILVREILDRMASFPAHLNLIDQGIFAIGYYHQMKDLWTSKTEDEKEKGGKENGSI